MHERRIKALPVIDRTRRVVGIVTQADFFRQIDLEHHEGIGGRLRHFIRATRTVMSNKPEVVGQIMTRQVRVASEDRPLAELVPLFSEGGHHHIPIIDAERRLAGNDHAVGFRAGALPRGRAGGTEPAGRPAGTGSAKRATRKSSSVAQRCRHLAPRAVQPVDARALRHDAGQQRHQAPWAIGARGRVGRLHRDARAFQWPPPAAPAIRWRSGCR